MLVIFSWTLYDAGNGSSSVMRWHEHKWHMQQVPRLTYVHVSRVAWGGGLSLWVVKLSSGLMNDLVGHFNQTNETLIFTAPSPPQCTLLETVTIMPPH